MVSIIILSYNTETLLHSCLASIYAKLKSVPYEVIILDNASTDQSVQMVRQKFPRTKLIQSDLNLGFGKGLNKAVLKAKGELLLFLNSDTRVENDFLGSMLGEFTKNSKLGILGGMLENTKSSSSSYGSFYTVAEIFRMLFLGKKNNTIPQKITDVDWVSGGFMMIRKSLFEKLSGFDPHFFMYIEDMELCFRANKMGYAVKFDPGARATHVGQGSSNRTFAIVNIYKGILYFYKKHKSPNEYNIVRSMLYFKASLSQVVGILTNNSYLVDTYMKAKAVL